MAGYRVTRPRSWRAWFEMGDRVFDIAVVGAGPAGACAAIKLARLGRRVLLLEQARFPRAHVGEALSPGVRTHLAALGLSELADSLGGLRFTKSALRWGSTAWESRLVHPAALTVDRGHLDDALIKAAQVAGVHVLQPARVARVEREPGGWRLEVDQEGQGATVQCRFLVDAAGRRGVLPRRRRHAAPSLVALHADWPDVQGDPCVTAGVDYWIWASPVPGRGRSVILFSDRAGLRRRKRSLSDHYVEVIRAAGIVEPGSQPGPVAIHDASAYCDEDMAGADFLKVGEAAFALDPLSSSGVQKAMASGIIAAIVANTVLLRPQDAGLALDFYRCEQTAAAGRHRAWTANVYAEQRAFANEPFWRERAQPVPSVPEPVQLDRRRGDLVLSNLAAVEWVASVSDAFIEPQRGLTHPNLERPLVYVGGMAIADLLPAVGCPGVEQSLRQRLPYAVAGTLVEKLVNRGVLVEAEVHLKPRVVSTPDRVLPTASQSGAAAMIL
jgi:flavin-dependent dehydrogenase